MRKNKCILLFLLVLFILLTGCNNSNSKYEKDLSSILDVSFSSSMNDVIEFEKSTYDHNEHSSEIDGTGNIMLGFAPYEQDDTTYYKHIYRFNSDTKKLQIIEYATILDAACFDGTNTCNHVESLKDSVLSVSSNWDEDDSNNSYFMMYGSIDGIKCEVKYYKSIELITIMVVE